MNKENIKSRKKNLIITLIILALFLTFNNVKSSETRENHVVFGQDNALIKIKILSSLSCPHCAKFHLEVVPKLKEEYVKTGKAQLIFIDFPLDLAAFNASKLLHCSDEKMQMKFLDIIYEEQDNWTSGSNIEEINLSLKKIVKNLGISPSEFDKCLVNEIISDKILNYRIESTQKYAINGTPTIIINEKKLEGSVNFKNIKKNIEKLI